MIKKATILTLLFSTLVFSNCANQSPPRAMADYSCAKDGMDNSSLIGTWIPDKETLEYMKANGRPGVSSKLSLRDDKSLVASDIPIGPTGETVSGNGKWNVSLAGKECFALEVKLETASSKLEIMKKSGERIYILQWYEGERRNNKLMVFVKQR